MTEKGFIAGGLGRVGSSSCSVYLTGRQLVQICVVSRSRARQTAVVLVEKPRGREKERALRSFRALFLYAFDARFAVKSRRLRRAFPVTSVYSHRGLDRISHLITRKGRRFRATHRGENEESTVAALRRGLRIAF